MLGPVQAAVLVLLTDAQQASHLEAKEQHAAQAAHPGSDGEDANDLRTQHPHPHQQQHAVVLGGLSTCCMRWARACPGRPCAHASGVRPCVR